MILCLFPLKLGSIPPIVHSYRNFKEYLALSKKLERNDIVVFSWPNEHSCTSFLIIRIGEYGNLLNNKSNYVKRCVAIAGDSLEIKDGYIYINGERTKLPDRAKPQYKFYVNTGGQQLSKYMISNRYQVRDGEWGRMQDGNYIINLTDQEAAQLAKNPTVNAITKIIDPKGTDGQVFPNVTSLGWNKDNYGPIYIPEKGKSVKLNKESLPFYNKIITDTKRFNIV